MRDLRELNEKITPASTPPLLHTPAQKSYAPGPANEFLICSRFPKVNDGLPLPAGLTCTKSAGPGPSPAWLLLPPLWRHFMLTPLRYCWPELPGSVG